MPIRKKGTKFKIEGAPGTSNTRGEALKRLRAIKAKKREK